ncbi:MAG: hypothetical protein HXY50_06260 [Ignavibacteriaceae bacterium]|nr:hypothetical protein [Ignavibacteriaceae bacterium]
MISKKELHPNNQKAITKPTALQADKKKMFQSFSFWSLLISNFLIIIFSIIERQNVFNILWAYWFQSVIIGLFNFLKIISLKDYTIDGLKMNNKVITKSKAAKVGVAVFFLFHYGFFHFIYAIFLIFFTAANKISQGGVDFSFILITSLIFLFNYLAEFIFSLKNDSSTVHSLPKLMMAPYKRIIPMHLTIILAGFVLAGGAGIVINPNTTILLIFTGLKTIVDLFTHQ